MTLDLLITHKTIITVKIHLDMFLFVGLLSWEVDSRLTRCGGHLPYIREKVQPTRGQDGKSLILTDSWKFESIN